MKILFEKAEERHIILGIEVDPENFKKAYLSHFTEVAKKVNIPGFRKGHAPLDMVLQALRSRGVFDDEIHRMLDKIVNSCVKKIPEIDKELDERIFGFPISNELKEFDISVYKLVFEAKFEKFPSIEVGDYSSLPTLIELKDYDGETCPLPKDKEASEKDVVAVSMLGRQKNSDPNLNKEVKKEESSVGEDSKVLFEYTYDMIEIDLENTKIRPEIISGIIGKKAGESVTVSFDTEGRSVEIEIKVLEVREKVRIDENFPLVKTFGGDVEKAKESVKNHYSMHNSFVRYQDIMKWLFSVENKLDPIPVENLRLEAHKTYIAHAKANKDNPPRYSLEDLVYEYIKNLKTTLVLNKISDIEKIEISDEDKQEFAKDITEQPWLYGYKPVEDIFNSSEEILRDYVRQFKTIRFLITKWAFKN